MVAMLVGDLPITIPLGLMETNYPSFLEAPNWHATVTKFHELLVSLNIDQIWVISSVMVVYNEDKIVQLKRTLAQWYWPQKILLYFNVQPLMWCKTIVKVGGYKMAIGLCYKLGLSKGI